MFCLSDGATTDFLATVRLRRITQFGMLFHILPLY